MPRIDIGGLRYRAERIYSLKRVIRATQFQRMKTATIIYGTANPHCSTMRQAEKPRPTPKPEDFSFCQEDSEF